MEIGKKWCYIWRQDCSLADLTEDEGEDAWVFESVLDLECSVASEVAVDAAKVAAFAAA